MSFIPAQGRWPVGQEIAADGAQARAHAPDFVVHPGLGLGARRAKYRHPIPFLPGRAKAAQAVHRGPEAEERVDQNAANAFFVIEADGARASDVGDAELIGGILARLRPGPAARARTGQ
ncbi:hypothetical protein [Phenylobacterium sp.]|uniref:hypothetical protein n=1 Tax=Phenylobacterium sp. TaxID=1871053 RepID=UPI002F40F1CC